MPVQQDLGDMLLALLVLIDAQEEGEDLLSVTFWSHPG